MKPEVMRECRGNVERDHKTRQILGAPGTVHSKSHPKHSMVAFLLLVVRPGDTSSFLLLVAMPFVPSSFAFQYQILQMACLVEGL